MFFVFGLPRSRTAWVSHLLTFGDARCGHDVILDCQNVGEFLDLFRSRRLSGSCETGAMMGWKILRNAFPKAKFITIRRPPMECFVSLAKFGLAYDLEELEKRNQILDVISATPGAWQIWWKDLDDTKVCGQLFEHCLGQELDPWHYEHIASTNIQIDMPRRVMKLRASAPAIAKMKEEVFAATVKIGGSPRCLGLQ